MFVSLLRYNFGWSHGKEKLESGKLGEFHRLFLLLQYTFIIPLACSHGCADMLKGSYYANPLQDVPTSDSSEMQR